MFLVTDNIYFFCNLNSGPFPATHVIIEIINIIHYYFTNGMIGKNTRVSTKKKISKFIATL